MAVGLGLNFRDQGSVLSSTTDFLYDILASHLIDQCVNFSFVKEMVTFLTHRNVDYPYMLGFLPDPIIIGDVLGPKQIIWHLLM